MLSNIISPWPCNSIRWKRFRAYFCTNPSQQSILHILDSLHILRLSEENQLVLTNSAVRMHNAHRAVLMSEHNVLVGTLIALNLPKSFDHQCALVLTNGLQLLQANRYYRMCFIPLGLYLFMCLSNKLSLGRDYGVQSANTD